MDDVIEFLIKMILKTLFWNECIYTKLSTPLAPQFEVINTIDRNIDENITVSIFLNNDTTILEYMSHKEVQAIALVKISLPGAIK